MQLLISLAPPAKRFWIHDGTSQSNVYFFRASGEAVLDTTRTVSSGRTTIVLQVMAGSIVTLQTHQTPSIAL